MSEPIERDTRHDTTEPVARQDATVAVSVAQAADTLRITTGAVRKRLERRQLRGFKAGGRWAGVYLESPPDATDTTNATRDTTGQDATVARRVAPVVASPVASGPDPLELYHAERAERLARDQEAAALRDRLAELEGRAASAETWERLYLEEHAERLALGDRLEAAAARDQEAAKRLAELEGMAGYWRGIATERQERLQALEAVTATPLILEGVARDQPVPQEAAAQPSGNRFARWFRRRT